MSRRNPWGRDSCKLYKSAICEQQLQEKRDAATICQECLLLTFVKSAHGILEGVWRGDLHCCMWCSTLISGIHLNWLSEYDFLIFKLKWCLVWNISLPIKHLSNFSTLKRRSQKGVYLQELLFLSIYMVWSIYCKQKLLTYQCDFYVAIKSVRYLLHFFTPCAHTWVLLLCFHGVSEEKHHRSTFN